MLFPISLILASTIFISLYVFLDIEVDLTTLFLILIFSFFLNFKARYLFSIKKSDFIFLFIVFILVFILYRTSSPVLIVAQDPGVYFLKAMNLINYGTTYVPIDTQKWIYQHELNYPFLSLTSYGEILNGTKFDGSKILLDFFAGPSFVITTLGLVHKPFVFYFSLIFLTAISSIFFLIIRNWLGPINSCILTIIFVSQPLLTWFGKGSYSEITALLSFLGIVYLLLNSPCINLKSINFLFLIGFIAVGLSSRYEFIFLTSFIVIGFYQSSLITRIGIALFSIFYSSIIFYSFPIYSERIGFYLPGIFESSLFVFFSIVISEIIFRNNLFQFKLLKLLLTFSGFVLFGAIIIIFILKYVSGDPELFLSHGKIIRTYNEETLQRLLLVIPSTIFFGGVASLILLNFISSTQRSAFLFLILSLTMFLPFLIDANNSPQMYWFFRRFVFIIIPVIYILFYWAISISPPYVIKFILIIVALEHSFLILNTKQIDIEMEGIEKSVTQFQSKYNSKIFEYIIYDQSLKYQVSPFISYVGLKPYPHKISSNDPIFNDKDGLYLISRSIKDKISFCEFSEISSLSYIRTGESYKELPKDIQNHSHDFNVYKCF